MRQVVEHHAFAEAGAGRQRGESLGSAVLAADDFDLAFLDDAQPLARRGFVKEIIPGLVGMRRAALNDRGQFVGGDADGLREGGDAFRSKSSFTVGGLGSVR